MYSFTEYSADIEHTRQGEHNTVAYNCCGMIGELGELISQLIEDVLPEPLSTDPLEREVMHELLTFTIIAKRIELLKKKLHRGKNRVLSNYNDLDEEDCKALREEASGVLWHLDSLCDNLKLSLGEAAFENQQMLRKRFNHNPNWMQGGEKLH